MNEMVEWRCPRGHVLGMVRRNGSKVQQMLLYRQAIDLTPNPSPDTPTGGRSGGKGNKIVEVDVMAIVEGLVLDVSCSICGGIRTWGPGPVRREHG